MNTHMPSSLTTTEISVLVVLAILILGFSVFCLVDLYRQQHLKTLTKPLWALIILAASPTGGICYLVLGRGGEPELTEADL